VSYLNERVRVFHVPTCTNAVGLECRLSGPADCRRAGVSKLLLRHDSADLSTQATPQGLEDED